MKRKLKITLEVTREMLEGLIDEMDSAGIEEGTLEISEWPDNIGYDYTWIKESENDIYDFDEE